MRYPVIFCWNHYLLIGDSGDSTHDGMIAEQQLDLFAQKGAMMQRILPRGAAPRYGTNGKLVPVFFWK